MESPGPFIGERACRDPPHSIQGNIADFRQQGRDHGTTTRSQSGRRTRPP